MRGAGEGRHALEAAAWRLWSAVHRHEPASTGRSRARPPASGVFFRRSLPGLSAWTRVRTAPRAARADAPRARRRGRDPGCLTPRANAFSSGCEARRPGRRRPIADFSVMERKVHAPEERYPRLRRMMEAVHAEFLETTAAQWPRAVAAFAEAEGFRALAYGPATEAGARLAAAWPARGPRLVPFDRPIEECKRELFEDVDAGFTTTRGGIAETGGLILWPSPQEPRLLSLVPPVHLALLRRVADPRLLLARDAGGGLGRTDASQRAPRLGTEQDRRHRADPGLRSPRTEAAGRGRGAARALKKRIRHAARPEVIPAKVYGRPARAPASLVVDRIAPRIEGRARFEGGAG